MYYLVDFSREPDSGIGFSPPKFFKKIQNTTGKVPGLNTQISDFLKEKGQQKFKEMKRNSKPPTLGQKLKMAKGYLRYRKHLGDKYGKEKGMNMLQNQKTFLHNAVNPSYRQKEYVRLDND